MLIRERLGYFARDPTIIQWFEEEVCFLPKQSSVAALDHQEVQLPEAMQGPQSFYHISPSYLRLLPLLL